MNKQLFLVTVHSVLLFCLLSVMVHFPKASKSTVHNLDSGLNYSSIQAAIDASETLAGHTIMVEAGTYQENVLLRKSVYLMGENRCKTVILANRTGNTVLISASKSKISGFSIQGGTSGILFRHVKNCTVSDNEVRGNKYGILLQHAGGNTLRRNRIVENLYNFHVTGRRLSDFVNDVDPSNTVDGKPICYWVNRRGEQVPLDAGYVAVVNSTQISVCDLHLSHNSQGILFAFVDNSTIERVETSENYDGMWITDCEDCRLEGNDASNNHHYGMELERLSSCKVVRNSAGDNAHKGYGIRLSDSSNVSLVANEATGNRYGIVVQFCRDCSVDQNNVSYNNGMGIWPHFCKECKITGNYACHNGFYGVEPEDSNHCLISGNNLSGNGLYGIWLFGIHGRCNNHEVVNNYIEGNKVGIALRNSSFNHIHHNNFIRNQQQAITRDSQDNLWNTDLEGNYWSDYNGFDDGYDGIGDADYIVDENNWDRHPLMGAFSILNTSQDYQIPLISNSTITDLKISDFNSTIKLYIANLSATQPIGFCRIALPKNLVVPPIQVVIEDESAEIVHLNNDLCHNNTYRWVYIAYREATGRIDVIFLILISILVLSTILVTIILFKRRREKKRH